MPCGDPYNGSVYECADDEKEYGGKHEGKQLVEQAKKTWYFSLSFVQDSLYLIEVLGKVDAFLPFFRGKTFVNHL